MSHTYIPLTTSLFVASIIGFFISVVYVIQFSETWAVTFAIVFLILFFASMLSMAHAKPARLDTKRKKHR
ncbi:hypothetical protein GF342_05855 [Candidatus Woesearchaeota archaeon]|nr:hypothetical protein [Candidatus Woesearchaeota archaeon]